MRRAAVLQLFHEASSVSPLQVNRDAFLSRHHMQGASVRTAFGATKNWMGGVLGALDEAGVETEIGLCTAALPGGPVDGPSFDILMVELLQSLDGLLASGPVSHVFLLLHGALLVEGRDDPEGDIAMAVRRRVGPDCCIAVPLDFHANPGPGLMAAANVVLGGKLYPHTDTRERGARLVALALGDPDLTTRHFPMGCAVPMPRQETQTGPFAELATLTNTLERGDVADVSLLGGFPFSDAPFAGTSLLVTAREGHAAIARTMQEAIEARMDALIAPVAGPVAAMKEVAAQLDAGRVVLADIGDNPGGGGLGDDTSLLPYLTALGRPFAFGALVMPQLVQAAQDVGVGGGVEISTSIGPLIAQVEALLDLRYRNQGPMMTGEQLNAGPSAVLILGQGRVLVTTMRIQAYDPEAFTAAGIEPHAQDILAIKSIGHFRAGYTPLASGGIVLVDTGGFSSPRRGISATEKAAPLSQI